MIRDRIFLLDYRNNVYGIFKTSTLKFLHIFQLHLIDFQFRVLYDEIR